MGKGLNVGAGAISGRDLLGDIAARLDWPRVATVGVAFASIVAMALSHGAYFPSTWGWSALVLSWVAVLALVLRSRIDLSLPEVVVLGALAALTGWTALSALWSSTVPGSILEVQRSLVYLVGMLAVLVLAPSSSWRALLGAVYAAIVFVSGYALGARLFPESFVQIPDDIGGYRLDEPIGYWNALGILVAVGAVLALGFAAGSSNLGVRAFAAASTVVLVPTLYFTFGRGPWLALAIGLGAFIAIDPRRLHTLAVLAALAPAPATAVWLASESDPLTRRGAPVAEVAQEGERFAVAVLALAVAAAVVVALFTIVERRIAVARGVRYAWAGTLGTVAVAALVAAFLRYGGPVTLVEKGYDSFKSPPVSVQVGERATKRLFTLSSNGRLDLWDVAWSDFQENALTGSGAGTYEPYWIQHRPLPLTVRDAHSLYVEMLAEVGVVGTAFLIVALAAPLAAAWRVRQRPLVPAASAAYVAFLVHAGADWDWEIPAVTFAGLLCAAGLLVAARPVSRPLHVPALARSAGAAVAVGIATVAFVSAVGNRAIAEAEGALFVDTEPERALTEARRATRWAPWSAEGWLWLGRAQVALGDEAAARGSFRRAIEKDPRNWALWLDLAYATEGAEKRAAAAEAVRLNPLGEELDLAFVDDEFGLTREDVEATR